MLNIYIYLNDQVQPEEIIEKLLVERLVANASIDIDNNYYELINGEVKQKIHVVVTAQTKALLFEPLIQFVAEHYSADIPIFASPLVAANTNFDQFIRNSTL